MPERVQFGSADGKTTLIGYVFKPSVQPGGRVPAVVMMHGRAGPYSSLAKGVYDATTLSQRHQFWGRLWAAQGYITVLVDSFGPRGYPQGFGRFTYASRPEELDEVTIRPLDAYGALAYLRSRADVVPDRIGLQGWSNGGSATLASMAPDALGIAGLTPNAGFRAALAFYPACGLKDHFATIGYRSYAPLRIFVGTADEEISPRVCRESAASCSRMPAATSKSTSTKERPTISTIPAARARASRPTPTHGGTSCSRRRTFSRANCSENNGGDGAGGFQLGSTRPATMASAHDEVGVFRR
jgi:carboxymethylenebutenolidase